MAQRRVFYGWIIVGAGVLVTCMGLGAMSSLSVFLKPISASMGWSRTGISTVALPNWIFMGIGSFFWGALSDRIGTRAVVLCGGMLVGGGLISASQATTLGQFQLLFGVIVGFAVRSFYAPMTSTAMQRTLLIGLAIQAVSVFLYLFTNAASAFYALAVIFGLSYGGVMPLYAILVREYFGERIMGTAYGAVFLVSTLGMALGSWSGGWFFDTFGSEL